MNGTWRSWLRNCSSLVGAVAGLVVAIFAFESLYTGIAPNVDWVVAQIELHPWAHAYLVSLATAIVIVGLLFRQREHRFQRLANEDSLTGLLNRRAFETRVKQELQRNERYGSPLAVLLVDVDKLKEINDENGHPAGDRVLRRVANSLLESCRSTDTAARLGGDEFAVLAPCTDGTAASELADRIRKMVETTPVAAHDKEVTVSIGVVGVDVATDETEEQLFELVDSMLYAAKDRGRNRVEVLTLSSDRDDNVLVPKRRSREAHTATASEMRLEVPVVSATGSHRAVYGRLRTSSVVPSASRGLLFLALGGLLSWGLVLAISHALLPYYSNGSEQIANVGRAQSRASLILRIDDELCSTCSVAIERAAQQLPGIIAMRLLKDPERVVVTYDPAHITPKGIASGLQRVGLRTEFGGRSGSPAIRESTSEAYPPVQLHSLAPMRSNPFGDANALCRGSGYREPVRA